MDLNLPYIQAVTDRNDVTRYYFRRKSVRHPLPGAPGSPEFLAAYQQALAESPRLAIPEAPQGSFDAARMIYYASAEFHALAATTQREMRYTIDAIARTPTKSGGKRGDRAMKTLERRHILTWRDKLRDKPGAANKMVRNLSAFFGWAVQRQILDANPCTGIKMMKLGEHRDWTDDELVQFEAHWKAGTMQRLAYALALYTGQRRADLVTIKACEANGDWIRFRQQKTGTVVEVFMHPSLAAVLAETTAKGDYLLHKADGSPMHPIYLGHFMADAIEAAGLPQHCVLHGLRKTTARIVEELGGKVSSITGHLSPQMERKYAKRANQKKNAKVAILDWARADKKKAKAKDTRTNRESVKPIKTGV